MTNNTPLIWCLNTDRKSAVLKAVKANIVFLILERGEKSVLKHKGFTHIGFGIACNIRVLQHSSL